MKSLLFTVLLAVFPGCLQAAVTDGLVAHYKFDEASGSAATDSIRGAAGNGILTNFGATPWVAGVIGGAVEADGVNDWISTPAAIANGATAMSFSGWVWADSRPTWASIVKNWGDSSAGQFHFGLNNTDGRLSNYLSNGTNVIDPTVFPTGSWQHVAFTYDGATHRLYRNGALVASLTTTTTLNQSSAVVAFGAKTNGAGTAPATVTPGHWDGKFDDFGFWNRALTAAEVASIYNAGLQGAGIAGAPPAAISSFTASPANVPIGGTTTLSWSVQYATTVTLNGGPFSNQDVTGQTSIVTSPLSADATFMLTATNPTGPASATVLVGAGAAVLPPVINEFLAANDTGIRDAAVEGDHEDWIEIHNPNSLYTLDLGGYHLTDDPGHPDKWTFPAMTLPPGGYLVVFASEKNRAIAGAPLHTNFKLSVDGEYLALVMPDGATVVQQFSPAYPKQTSDISYCSAGYLATPTPGAPNSGLAGPAITAVTENPPPPLDGDSLTIAATVTPQIGTTVSSVALVYRVMYGSEVSVPMTQGAAGLYSAVIPASVSTSGQMIRWKVIATDSAGRSSRAPLFRDPTNSPEYLGTVVQNPAVASQLPIIERFVQNPTGIDGDPGTRCSVFFNGEFFDNLGIRIRGFTSRSWPKKSHKIEMNSGHHFRFQADAPRVSEFDLNTTYTDKAYVRATLTSEMQRSIGMASPQVFPVQIRQNGSFYSVALFTENPDTDFLQRHGLDPDGAYYKAPTNNTYATSSTFEKKTRLYESGKADLDALISALGLTGTSLETYVFDNVDLPAMVNYIATTCIAQNIDASDKNHFAYRDTNFTGEWSMLPWDLDLTLGPNALNTDTIVYNQNYASHPFVGATPYLIVAGKNNRFLEAIINTPRSRDMVIRRIRSLMDQFLATNWLQNRIDQLVPTLDADVTLDHVQWGTSSHFSGSTYTLLAATNRIKNEYLAPRRTYLESGGTVGIPASQPATPQINFGAVDANPASGNQDQEYVELINPNAFSVDVSGWMIDGGITHTMKSGTVMLPGSSLYLTPSPSAFRARTTGPRGVQRLFVQGIAHGHLSSLGETLTLQNAAGSTIATLGIPPAPSAAQLYLRITELHYHPPGNGLAEFIELQNTSATATLDLSGVHFSDGVEFAFTAGTMLAPGECILVVRDIAAFSAAFGTGQRIAGVFANGTNLSHGGERIALDDASNSTIQEVNYKDAAPWPVAADGAGSSLHFVVHSSDAPGINEAVRWFADAPNPGIVPIDADGDGYTDYEEWLAGTDPGDGAQFFALTSIVRGADGSVTGTFSAAAGKTFRVFTSTDLVTWAPLGAVITASATGPQAFTDPAAGVTQRFYKVCSPAP